MGICDIYSLATPASLGKSTIDLNPDLVAEHNMMQITIYRDYKHHYT